MGEQHDLAEAERLQLVQAIDDRRAECRSARLRAGRKPVCRTASRRAARTLGSESSSGASAITASTDITIVSGITADVVADRSQHRDLVLEFTERIRGHVPYVGIPRNQRQRVLLADATDDDRRPRLPTGPGLIGMSRTVKCLPAKSIRSSANAGEQSN